MHKEFIQYVTKQVKDYFKNNSLYLVAVDTNSNIVNNHIGKRNLKKYTQEYIDKCINIILNNYKDKYNIKAENYGLRNNFCIYYVNDFDYHEYILTRYCKDLLLEPQELDYCIYFYNYNNNNEPIGFWSHKTQKFYMLLNGVVRTDAVQYWKNRHI